MFDAFPSVRARVRKPGSALGDGRTGHSPRSVDPGFANRIAKPSYCASVYTDGGLVVAKFATEAEADAWVAGQTHDPGAANDPPDPDLDACDTVEEVLGWLLNNAPADERIEVNEVVEAALRRIEQIAAVVS